MECRDTLSQASFAITDCSCPSVLLAQVQRIVVQFEEIPSLVTSLVRRICGLTLKPSMIDSQGMNFLVKVAMADGWDLKILEASICPPRLAVKDPGCQATSNGIYLILWSVGVIGFHLGIVLVEESCKVVFGLYFGQVTCCLTIALVV